jgi:phosphotransferase system HPr-like phosphotransfer protein
MKNGIIKRGEIMEIKYRLLKDIVARTATGLSFDLTNAKAVFFIKEDRCINGKSLLGILSGQFRMGDIITVKGEVEKDMEIIKEAFNTIGEVIN